MIKSIYSERMSFSPKGTTLQLFDSLLDTDNKARNNAFESYCNDDWVLSETENSASTYLRFLFMPEDGDVIFIRNNKYDTIQCKVIASGYDYAENDWFVVLNIM